MAKQSLLQEPAAHEPSAGPSRGSAPAPAGLAGRIRTLQHTAGNAAIARVLSSRLPRVQRECACGGTCPNCKARAGISSDSKVRILEGRGSGAPLLSDVQRSMETQLGHDFGRVRVHTDAHAARTAESIDATAYTVGRDIFFAQGRYRPETDAGRKLLAHELTHVVQQGAQDVPSNAALHVNHPGDSYEQEAERVATSLRGDAQISRVTDERRVQRMLGDFKDGDPKAADKKDGSGKDSKPAKKSGPGAVTSARFTKPTPRDGQELQASVDLRAFQTCWPSCFPCSTGWELSLARTFEVWANFTPATPADGCGCGEYRQKVKDNVVGFDQKLDTSWGRGYGMRDKPQDTSRFYAADTKEPGTAPHDAKGCFFWAQDTPAVKGFSATDMLEMDLEFEGTLVDKCNGDAILKDEHGDEQKRTWTMKGGPAPNRAPGDIFVR